MGSLEGKVAIITGAGSGIGRSTAIAFAREGADMIIVGRRVAPLQEVAAEAAKLGRKAVIHSIDLEDTDAAAIVLCAAMPHLTQIHEIRLLPTQPRDTAEESRVAARMRSPE
ncbi:MAG: SDR family NAD(P)-dependent oxidoreductase [Spirochaetales bacterium]|nr:SDR family NAD(P)-dependent oxidoreductase [Spirochaetales bacterium]